MTFKRTSFFLLFLLSFALIPSMLHSAMFDPSLKWFTLKTDHFKVHYYEGEEEVAQKSAGYLEEAYEILGKKFGVYPWERIQVTIVDNSDSANGFATVLPYNTILLRVVPPSPRNPLSNYDDWLRMLIMHEYTHIIHFNDIGYPMKIFKFVFGKLMVPNGLTPMWVSEGMATFYETELTTAGRGRSSFSEMLIRTDILNDQFLKLDQMAGSQYDWPGYMAGYIYGVKFWQYLGDTYGEEKVIEFSHKVGASPLFYMLNRQSKRTYGKKFKVLWTEWRDSLRIQYAKESEEVKARGLKEGEVVVAGEDSYLRPILSKDGKFLSYVTYSTHSSTEVRIKELAEDKDKIILSQAIESPAVFSPDGSKVAYSSLMPNRKKHTSYQDLSLYDLETKKVKVLTIGKRARDPKFSPNGKKIVFVMQDTGFSSLAEYDLESEEIQILYKGKPWMDFSEPSYSPDGKSIVVSLWHEGQRDIYIFNKSSKSLKRITNDMAQDAQPVWQGDSIYFSSDRSGISNIYRYSVSSGKIQMLSNVLTGAFSPTVSSKGIIYFQYYNGRGYEVRRTNNHSVPLAPWGEGRGEGGASLAEREDKRSSEVYTAKKYSPFSPSLLPHYLQPDLLFLDGAVFASAFVASNDPLGWHHWNGSVNYRTDASYVGFGAGYSYTRWNPTFFAGVSRFAVNYGNALGTGSDYFEERLVGRGGVGYTFFGKHGFSVSYLYEDRSNLDAIPVSVAPPSRGRYAGLHLKYNTGSAKMYPASISVEKGYRLTSNFQITDSKLGADENLEQKLFWGDGRVYIPMPWQHHVLALRTAGGIAWGDSFSQGSFGIGGSVGEGLLTGTSSRVFTLRGLPLYTFSSSRAMVMSAEYRIPLFDLQRGLGTTPFFMKKAHAGIFADYGDAWNANQKTGSAMDFFDDFFLGVGAELRGDFVLFYHVPMTGRIGYGVIVLNRDRINALNIIDPYTSQHVRNGILILELGTSF